MTFFSTLGSKISNFCSAFKNKVAAICGVIGSIAVGLVASPIPMPAWLRLGLRIVGIAAPTAGAVYSVVKHIAENRQNTKPADITEKLVSSNNDVDEETYDDIDMAYEELRDVTADEIRTKTDSTPRRHGKYTYTRTRRNFKPVEKTTRKAKSSNRTPRRINPAILDRVSKFDDKCREYWDTALTCEDVAFGIGI
jgi:hypothetical protein